MATAYFLVGCIISKNLKFMENSYNDAIIMGYRREQAIQYTSENQVIHSCKGVYDHSASYVTWMKKIIAAGRQ